MDTIRLFTALKDDIQGWTAGNGPKSTEISAESVKNYGESCVSLVTRILVLNSTSPSKSEVSSDQMKSILYVLSISYKMSQSNSLLEHLHAALKFYEFHSFSSSLKKSMQFPDEVWNKISTYIFQSFSQFLSNEVKRNEKSKLDQSLMQLISDILQFCIKDQCLNAVFLVMPTSHAQGAVDFFYDLVMLLFSKLDNKLDYIGCMVSLFSHIGSSMMKKERIFEAISTNMKSSADDNIMYKDAGKMFQCMIAYQESALSAMESNPMSSRSRSEQVSSVLWLLDIISLHTTADQTSYQHICKNFERYLKNVPSAERSCVAELVIKILPCNDAIEMHCILEAYQQEVKSYHINSIYEVDLVGRVPTLCLSILQQSLNHSASSKQAKHSCDRHAHSHDIISCGFLYEMIANYTTYCDRTDATMRRVWATILRNHHMMISSLQAILSHRLSDYHTQTLSLIENMVQSISDVNQWQYMNMNNILALLKVAGNCLIALPASIYTMPTTSHCLHTTNDIQLIAGYDDIINQCHTESMYYAFYTLVDNISKSSNKKDVMDIVDCVSSILLHLISRTISSVHPNGSRISPGCKLLIVVDAVLVASLKINVTYYQSKNTSDTSTAVKFMNLIAANRSHMIMNSDQLDVASLDDASFAKTIVYIMVFNMIESLNSAMPDDKENIIQRVNAYITANLNDICTVDEVILMISTLITSSRCHATRIEYNPKSMNPILILHHQVVQLVHVKDNLTESSMRSYESCLSEVLDHMKNVISIGCLTDSKHYSDMIGCLIFDIITIHNAMCSYGYISGQVTLFRYFDKIMEIIDKYHDKKPHHSILFDIICSSFRRCYDELKTTLLIQLGVSNIHMVSHWTGKLTENSLQYVRSFVDIQEESTITDLAKLRNHIRCGINIVCECKQELNNDEDVEKHIEHVLKEISSMKAIQQAHHIIPQLLTTFDISSSICLFYAKYFLYCSGNIQSAHKWSRRGLSYMKGVEKANPMNIMLQIECLLVIADSYEIIGQSESSLSYIAEATALTNSYKMASLNTTMSCHLLRIWSRFGSKRVDDIIIEASTYCKTSSTFIDEISDINYHVIDMMSKSSHPINKHSIKREALNDIWKQLSTYRFMNLYLAPISSRESKTSQYASMDNCIVKSALRNDLNAIYSIYHPISTSVDKFMLSSNHVMISSSSSSSTTSSAAEILSTLDHLQSSYFSFDSVRSLRRTACSNILTSSYDNKHNHHCGLQAFILGSASCHVSLESSLETLHDSKDRATPYLCMQHAAKIIRSACIGDVASMNTIEESLYADTVFIAIEPCQTKILVGRYFKAFKESITISLHVDQEMADILDEWNMIIRENDRLLHVTSGVDVAKNLSSADKRQWWSERQENNVATQDFLLRLEKLLGSWLWLVSSQITKPTCMIESQSYDQTELENMISSMHIGATSSSKHSKSESTMRSKSMKSESKSSNPVNDITLDGDMISIIQPWLKVMCACDLSDDNIISCVASLLRSHYPDYNAESISKLTSYVSPMLTNIRRNQSYQQSTAADDTYVDHDIDTVDQNRYREELENLKVTELRARLKSIGLSAIGKKDELTARLIEASTSTSASISKSTTTSSNHLQHIVLILDEKLQKLPWEGIPALHNASVTRMPSLVLLLSMHQSSTSIDRRLSTDPRRAWYLIDPENNLPSSRETMHNYLKTYIERWTWLGYIATSQTADALRKHHEDSELFIYCGHGSGDKFIDTYKLKKKRCPTALLWGCSSGRLISRGIHDPSGAALNYLLGGANAVIGNLWDVTDKDLDKYSIRCMTYALGSELDDQSQLDLAIATQKSREVCKLKYIVGCAPVIYGYPTKLKI